MSPETRSPHPSIPGRDSFSTAFATVSTNAAGTVDIDNPSVHVVFATLRRAVSGAPTPRHVKAAAVAGLSGGGSLLHDPCAAGRVQVILDSGLAGEEKFHPIQGKPLCVIPRRPAAAGQRGDIPINIALPNDDL